MSAAPAAAQTCVAPIEFRWAGNANINATAGAGVVAPLSLIIENRGTLPITYPLGGPPPAFEFFPSCASTAGAVCTFEAASNPGLLPIEVVFTEDANDVDDGPFDDEFLAYCYDVRPAGLGNSETLPPADEMRLVRFVKDVLSPSPLLGSRLRIQLIGGSRVIHPRVNPLPTPDIPDGLITACAVPIPASIQDVPAGFPADTLVQQLMKQAGVCVQGVPDDDPDRPQGDPPDLGAGGVGTGGVTYTNETAVLQVAEVCEPALNAAGELGYRVTASVPPTPPPGFTLATLENCVVTSPAGTCTSLSSTTLAPGDIATATCTSPVVEDAATVTCDIQGQPSMISSTVDPPAPGCFCDVQLDRQVSCDGGQTWVDATNSDPADAVFDDGVTDLCTTSPIGPVKVRWVAVDNSFEGNNPPADVICDLNDGNPNFGIVDLGVSPPQSVLGQTPDVVAMTPVNQCSAVLDGEPAGVTASISCDCEYETIEEILNDIDEDTAGFMCEMREPELEVTKVCEPLLDQATGQFLYTVTVSNVAPAGHLPLTNCQVVDSAASGCDTTFVGPINPGESRSITCASEFYTNTATVTCDGLAPEQASDECPVDVEVDKQVSCDSGQTWHDVGFGDPDGAAGISGCIGWKGVTDELEQIKVRYLARTTGYLVNCTLYDDNTVFIGPQGIPVGTSPNGEIYETTLIECNPELEGWLEPDTATLACECLPDPQLPPEPVEDSDTANVECLEATVDVAKECASNNGDGTYTYAVTVTNPENPDGAALENCRLEDPLAVCGPLSQTALAPGEMATAQCTGQSNMNMVTAICDIPGTFQLLDPCPDLLLENDTVVGTEAYSTCGELLAGPNYVVMGPSGDLTLTAGNAVVLADGFEVGVDATLIAGHDPALAGAPKTVWAEAMDGCVDLDKQISCDGGVTFVDLGYNDSLAESCIGWSGTDPSAAEIVFRYRARTGVAMTQCVLEDTNTAVLAAPVAIGDLAAKYDDFIYQTPLPLFCDAVEPWEPDTATLNCISTESGVMVTDDDSADLECQAPAVELDKVCVGEEPAGTFNYTLQVTNPAGVKRATIANCVVSDADSSCDGAQFAGPFTPGQTSTPIDCTSQSALNTASVTCDILNEDLQTTGKTISDEDTAECLCEIKVDKQISCSSGWSFVDTGFDDGVEESCVGWLGQDEIVYRYEVVNTGTVGVSSCTLVDTNSAVGAAGVIPISDALQPGETASHDNPLLECGTALAGGEPDTALFTCSCAGFEDRRVSSSDSADLECRTADLAVTKTCEQQVDNENHVTITYENVGDANLVNCVVVDEVFLDDPECPADVGSPSPIPMSPASGIDLAPGQGGTSTGVVFDLAVDACNRVTVTCEIEGALDETGQVKTITETADDLCMPQRAGCYSRTPGFWGTHPRVTELFLPVASCGLPIDNTGVETPGSAIEDMCWDGTDAAANDTSPQQLQLIRQCTAAALNLAVTAEAGGSCEREFPGISEAYQECCASLCTTGLPGQTIGDSGCIQIIDAFNNSVDSLSCDGPNPLPYPFCPGLGANGFPAEPDLCTQAGGNGFVNPGRNLGPM